MDVVDMKTPAEPPSIPQEPVPLACSSPDRPSLSTFERVVCSNPPILDSLFAQLTTQDALHIYHTSPYLRAFLRNSPTAWRFVSWRLYQQTVTAPTPTNSTNQPKQSSNYALDHLLISVINPYSTRLQSLELDNTAVSGSTLSQTVLVLRRDTLQHLSVRGCKNVSLKYHINPWLQMHALAKQAGVFPYDKLALKSLYTYRCRHHRRRPYLPQSLNRKESDSEPTHELVKACHELGIWTDTAWCTTPGPRCFRRRGYVTMRTPQDPREVWVVFDRLWRSKNWIGPAETNSSSNTTNASSPNQRRSDPRLWESQEVARKGEATGISGDGKDVPMHLRASHRVFVEDHQCHQCGETILERCEQCSILMHCSGCRKTLCASCAFDRPYLRNKTAPKDDRNKFWWAPGCAISPCSMQDSDTQPPFANAGNLGPGNALPNLRFKWCCTEPVFSGGGGISFQTTTRNADHIRAAPLPKDHGWEDKEFAEASEDSSCGCTKGELAGRWKSLPDFFIKNLALNEQGVLLPALPVPRMLCEDCHSSPVWRINCKSCSTPICIKHDFRDKMKIRICGVRDVSVEAREYLAMKKKWDQRIGKLNAGNDPDWELLAREFFQQKLASLNHVRSTETRPPVANVSSLLRQSLQPCNDQPSQMPVPTIQPLPEGLADDTSSHQSILETDLPQRPSSRGSNVSDTISRASSPAPSAETPPVTPEPKSTPRKAAKRDIKPSLEPPWKAASPSTVVLLDLRATRAEDAWHDATVYRMQDQPAQAAQAGRIRRPKNASKLRQSTDARRPSSSNTADPDIMAGFLGEFSEMRFDDIRPLTISERARILINQPTPNVTQSSDLEQRNVEEVGILVRELATRMRDLRAHFGPDSPAARALPNITIDDDGTEAIIQHVEGLVHIDTDSSGDDPSS
ncbi:uncharacterized protein AB675_3385 [Cyphellophora attinorum]|uniref:Uncharacterized protein n=1 Tax=Cyphellophora attinorum TaxID=1664694 RepID=A0A0N1P040_9EURO|nr:uncharacterized protein AB675_3385 [Phialophora attinorum]KPI39744.1 hypothetical protein AB675_3385 [Phialophora attinorum]